MPYVTNSEHHVERFEVGGLRECLTVNTDQHRGEEGRGYTLSPSPTTPEYIREEVDPLHWDRRAGAFVFYPSREAALAAYRAAVEGALRGRAERAAAPFRPSEDDCRVSLTPDQLAVRLRSPSDAVEAAEAITNPAAAVLSGLPLLCWTVLAGSGALVFRRWRPDGTVEAALLTVNAPESRRDHFAARVPADTGYPVSLLMLG